MESPSAYLDITGVPHLLIVVSVILPVQLIAFTNDGIPCPQSFFEEEPAHVTYSSCYRYGKSNILGVEICSQAFVIRAAICPRIRSSTFIRQTRCSDRTTDGYLLKEEEGKKQIRITIQTVMSM